MSVLIEALTLVMKQSELDMRYPGGAEAFLLATLELENPPRYCVGADPHLVNVSFYDPDHLRPCVELLESHGFTDVEDDHVVDIAYLDQRYGPTMPCEWLEWKQHPDGFTLAWLAGTEPGDMAVPEGWTVEQSRALQRKDARDMPERMLKLAEEDGFETWLDLETGLQVKSLATRDGDQPQPRRETVMTTEEGDTLGPEDLNLEALLEEIELEEELDAEHLAARKAELGPLMRGLIVGLEAMKWHYELHMADDLITARTTTEHTEYRLGFHANEEAGVLRVWAGAAFRVPAEKRTAICEVLNRANYGLGIGGFEMDMRDGEVLFRVGLDQVDAEVTRGLVKRIIGTCIETFERYVPAIMQVVYAGATPIAAIQEVEG